ASRPPAPPWARPFYRARRSSAQERSLSKSSLELLERGELNGLDPERPRALDVARRVVDEEDVRGRHAERRECALEALARWLHDARDEREEDRARRRDDRQPRRPAAEVDRVRVGPDRVRNPRTQRADERRRARPGTHGLGPDRQEVRLRERPPARGGDDLVEL